MDKEAIVTSPAGPSRQSPCRETSGLRAGSSVEALKNASDLAEPSTSGLPATANAGHGKKSIDRPVDHVRSRFPHRRYVSPGRPDRPDAGV
jgi:hypothetical protein